MNKTATLWYLFAVLAILGAASAAPAAVLFTETFSYPDGILGSEPPDGGVSGGLWTRTVGTTPVTVGNAKVTLYHFSAISHFPSFLPESATRGFSGFTSGQTVYAGLDVSATGNTATAGATGAGLYFAAFSSTKLFVTAFTGSDFTFGIGHENTFSVPTVSWPSGLTFGTTYRVVMSYEIDTGSSKLWVNPVDESSSYVSFSNTAFRAVSPFWLRQNRTPEFTPPATQVLDNLVVGTTFNDVLAIPASTLPGDFNLDGTVDAADYVAWRKNDGSQEGYNTWRTNFGRTAGGGSGDSTGSSNAVPEPSWMALLLCGVMLLCWPRQIVAGRT